MVTANYSLINAMSDELKAQADLGKYLEDITRPEHNVQRPIHREGMPATMQEFLPTLHSFHQGIHRKRVHVEIPLDYGNESFLLHATTNLIYPEESTDAVAIFGIMSDGQLPAPFQDGMTSWRRRVFAMEYSFVTPRGRHFVLLHKDMDAAIQEQLPKR